MTKKTRSELQNIFRQGATPSGEDFKDLIQSTLNVTDVGIDKPVEDEPLKIIANGIEEKLLDFYAGDTKTWSIDQKPNENNPGLNISTESQSKLFIAKDTGNVGISTDSPGAKLEISGDLKLRFGVAVNKFSTDGTLADNSDLVIPTEKAIKTYADTKASLAGSSSQDFTANNLTVNGTTGLSVNGTAKIEFSQSMRQMINLWGAGNPYGIGIQHATVYFRTHKNFAWYKQGSHDSNELNPGTGGTVQMVIKEGNVGIGTDNPGEKLEVNGKLKLQSGVAVDEFSTDGTLNGDSDSAIPTQKAIKTYADTKASLAGSSSQDFTANNLTVNGTTGLSVNGNAKIEFSQSLRQMINLWGDDHRYGIGIQDYTIYFRTLRNFAWYQDGSHDSNELNPGTGGTAQMVIKDGNVGIATNNPSEKLEVNGNIKSSGLNVSGDSNLATLSVTGDTNLNTLNVDNPIFQKLDIIACENNSNWSSSTHPIKVYFHNKLQGKPPGTMIYALTDHPEWQGFIWQGWVDATEGTSLIRVTHSYANTKATTTNNSNIKK